MARDMPLLTDNITPTYPKSIQYDSVPYFTYIRVYFGLFSLWMY